ncbi:Phospholipase A(2) [Zostera marina]|uniref:Phospholipase A(2) n=1 Tax=Zostera marina TaxID=29655 RepID=A0A0K9PK26_ZOSMR|nr:Phospholipase A(2) [Zostera marina]
MKQLLFLFSFPSPIKLPWYTSSSNGSNPSATPKPQQQQKDDRKVDISRSNPYLSFSTSNYLNFPQLLSSLWAFLPTLPPQPSPITRPVNTEHTHPLFRPYVAKVPWHGGVRAFLSQLFPRYGHYCGPNWSSGKDHGSLLWDQRPIDWLDFCCYCHDIGYDTDDQSKLLKADLAFLECLESPKMVTKGDAATAQLYRTMCLAGLKNVLIPYRMQLVRLQSQVVARR